MTGKLPRLAIWLVRLFTFAAAAHAQAMATGSSVSEYREALEVPPPQTLAHYASYGEMNDIAPQPLYQASASEQSGNLKILAWPGALAGLILCGIFLLYRARRKQTELAQQIELKTSSLTAVTLEAAEHKHRAEHLQEKLQNVLRTSAIGIWGQRRAI